MNVMEPINCYCDGERGCRNEFTVTALQVANLDNGIERTYFTCPHCQQLHTCFYTNVGIRKLLDEINRIKLLIKVKPKNQQIHLKYGRQIIGLNKKISAQMKNLRNQIEQH